MGRDIMEGAPPSSLAAMVIASQSIAENFDTLQSGLSDSDRESVSRALEYARGLYADRLLSTSEPALEHALGMARCVADLKLDAAARVAALLFAVPTFEKDAERLLEARFGQTVGALVSGISRLNELRVVTRASVDEQRSPNRASATGMAPSKHMVASLRGRRSAGTAISNAPSAVQPIASSARSTGIPSTPRSPGSRPTNGC